MVRRRERKRGRVGGRKEREEKEKRVSIRIGSTARVNYGV